MTHYKAYGSPFLKRTNFWSNIPLHLHTIKEVRIVEAAHPGLPKRRIGYEPTTLQERYTIPAALVESLVEQSVAYQNNHFLMYHLELFQILNFKCVMKTSRNITVS
jgi:hypothetical protein